jgi:hypothetical protein
VYFFEVLLYLVQKKFSFEILKGENEWLVEILFKVDSSEAFFRL